MAVGSNLGINNFYFPDRISLNLSFEIKNNRIKLFNVLSLFINKGKCCLIQEIIWNETKYSPF